jgi:hypothetical protein
LARADYKASERMERDPVALLQRSLDLVQDLIDYLTCPTPGELCFNGDGIDDIGFRQRRISYCLLGYTQQ